MEHEPITSRSNRLIIDAAKLKQKKYRDENGVFFFEGKKLLADAVRSGVKLNRVFFTRENRSLVLSYGLDCDLYEVAPAVYEKLTDENSPSGVFCVALHLDRIKKMRTIYKDEDFSDPFAVISVRDPGNLGTLIRTANAFSTGTLILSGDCADVYNPKTVRASMGALFRQKIVIFEDDPSLLPGLLHGKGYETYAAALHTEAISLDSLKAGERTCFCVGNEGHGLPDGFIKACGKSVFIPMNEEAESLNVASAATVLLWEARKGRIRKDQKT